MAQEEKQKSESNKPKINPEDVRRNALREAEKQPNKLSDNHIPEHDEAAVPGPVKNR